MNIAKEIYLAHRQLSTCSARFIDFVNNHPNYGERSHFNPLFSQGHRFRYTRFQPWPTFINQKTRETLKQAAIKVYQLIKSIPMRLFSSDIRQISHYYGIKEDMTELLIYGVDKVYLDSLIGRGDFILSSNGQLKCIEFNVQANMGGWELDLMEPVYVNIPVISKFLAENNIRIRQNRFFPTLLHHVLQAFLEKPGQARRTEINTAIVFPELLGIVENPTSEHIQSVYKSILREKYGTLKGNLVTCGFDVLKVSKECLFSGNKRIDILIEMNNGMVPFPYLTAVKAGNLMLYNGPITRIISNKLNIALLSEHEHSDKFTADEQAVISTYIPWTRKVIPGETTYGTEKIKLEEFVYSRQEMLVLKPSDGLGGQDVYPGRNTSREKWREILGQAFAEKNWVIQEYIPSPSFLYQTGENEIVPHQTVLGLFTFGSRYGGGFVRVLPEHHDKGVINTQQGAEKSIIIEVEEQEQDNREETMEITHEMKEMYRSLSTVNLDFLEFTRKNPNSHQRSSFKLLELDDDLFTLQPWPTFINGNIKAAFREAGVELFNLIKRIPKRIFNNDPVKMGAYYEYPAKELQTQMEGASDDHIDSLVGRGDFIVSASGLKCLEYNVAASMGGWQIPIWEHMYLNHPLIARFLNEHGLKSRNENLLRLFLEHAVQTTLGKIPGCDNEINIAFVLEGILDNFKGSVTMYLNTMYREILRQKNMNLKGAVMTCDYHHLSVLDNCVFYRGNRIHALVEMYLGYVAPDIMKAFKAGNLRLINGPMSFLLSNKLNLVLLSDPEHNRVFTENERNIIDKYVPWTRKITRGSTTFHNETITDLEGFIRSNQERLVIKPSMGLGGKDICVGTKCSQQEWQDTLNTALKEKNWLVQELIESAPGFYQVGEKGYDLHDMVWGFFVFGSRYCGAWNRVMPRKGSKGIINCHLGATVSIVLEV